jgi:hypothetical protein
LHAYLVAVGGRHSETQTVQLHLTLQNVANCALCRLIFAEELRCAVSLTPDAFSTPYVLLQRRILQHTCISRHEFRVQRRLKRTTLEASLGGTHHAAQAR